MTPTPKTTSESTEPEVLRQIDPDDYVRIHNASEHFLPSKKFFTPAEAKLLVQLERRAELMGYDDKRRLEPLTVEEREQLDALKDAQRRQGAPMIDGFEFTFEPLECHWIKWDKADFLTSRWPELKVIPRDTNPQWMPKGRRKRLPTATDAFNANFIGNDRMAADGKQYLATLTADLIPNATHENQVTTHVVTSKAQGSSR